VTLSIIVYENRDPSPTLERWIIELLRSIDSTHFRGLEIIFVIERSTALLSWLQSQAVNSSSEVKLVFTNERVGLSGGRNIGVLNSFGDYIAFVDDDEVVDPTWADAVLSTLADPRVIAVTGPSVPLSEVGDLDWFPREFEWLLSCTGWTSYVDGQEIRSAYGNNMAFRRSAFKGGRGFLTSMGLKAGDRGSWRETGAEDVEFCMRIRRQTGGKIVYCEGMRVRHRVTSSRISAKYVAQRAFWVGRGRRTLQLVSSEDSHHVLDLEWSLFRRSIFSFVFNILPSVFKDWRKGGKALRIAILAFVFAGIGYLFETLSVRGHRG